MLSQDVTYHTRTKHINVAYHFICEKVASHEAVLTYIPMKDNIVDILTKGLKLHQHCYLMGKLGFGIRNFSLRGSVGNNINNDYQSPTTKPVRALAQLDLFPFLSPFSLYGLSYCMPELTSLTSYCALS